MMRRMLVGCALLMCGAIVHAQSPAATDMAAVIDEQSMDVMPFGSAPGFSDFSAMDFEKKGGPGGVSEETVGDPDSFGLNKIYLGVAQTATVSLRADCSAYPPDTGICIETVPAPAVTHVDESDLAVIELPGRSTNSILCFTLTPFQQWQWYNGTGSQQSARMMLRPAVRIESDVLNDPTLINPITGLPFNGVLSDTTVSTFLQERTLDPNESDFQFHATTRNCTGGLVSVRSLRDSYGLSDAVIKDFFKEPITLSFGVRGHVSMVENASYFLGIRLYGDR